MSEILIIEKINSYYGKSHILFDVSLSVSEGETLCLMGRNGAGKSTTFRSVVAVVRPKTGKILFKGRDNGPQVFQDKPSRPWPRA
jgi:branched-chain amino acid transport system ATP-binding protein